MRWFPVLAAVVLAGRPVAAQSADSTKGLPLTPGRTIAIDTDEGTWISVDVAPDGKTVVFDLLGDLYTVPLAGGPATRLTSGMALDAQPRYSPDGRWITFTSDRDGAENVWIMNLATGATRRLSRFRDKAIQSPEWTPDGGAVVASVGDMVYQFTPAGVTVRPGKLWQFQVDGGAGIPLITEPEALLTTGAAFGGDPRYLWFAQRSGLWAFDAMLPQYQVAVYDRTTGAREVTTARYGSAFRPTLSPDGKWLVYATRYEASTGLVLRELESGDERWLAYPVQRDDQEAVASRDVYPGMSFTPDSKELVTSYGGKIWRVPIDGSAPIPVPFRVKTTLDLGPSIAFRYPISDSREFRVRQIRGLALSPDGTKLAFTALDRLYLMDWPRGTPKRLTTDDVIESDPTWSPDGAWIGYATWQRAGGTVAKIRADRTGPPVTLTAQRANYQQPAWSPDGSRLVAIRGPAEPRRAGEGTGVGLALDLVAIPAAGGPVTRIARTLGRRHPHFTTDPDRIYLYGPGRGLVSIRWDGTDERQHLKVLAPLVVNQQSPAPAELVTMAPTGGLALVQHGYEIFTVTVPPAGRDAPTISLQDPGGASVPARRLGDLGGEFSTWSADGRRIIWALGSSVFSYDRDRVAAVDSIARRRFEPDEVAVTVRVARDIPRGTVVLRGARVVTMRGQEVLENADVVVTDDRIVRVGARGAPPTGARVVDVSGTTIVPGFVDTHAHLRPPASLHAEQPWMYLANLAYGVTTTRDPQTGTSDVVSYGDMVEAGQIVGPRIYSTAAGIAFWAEPIRDLEHARAVTRRYSRYWDTKTVKMYLKGNRQVRQWLAIAAREQGVMPTTEGARDTKYDLTMLLDGYPGQEHAIPTVPIYRDLITAYAQAGIAYTPTLIVDYGGPWGENWFFTKERPYDDAKIRRFMPYEHLAEKTRRRGPDTPIWQSSWFMDEEYHFPMTAKAAAEIVRAGGRVAIGSHGEFQGLGYHWELWMMGSGGMTPHEVLRAATLAGAQALGLDGDLGSIEAGKLADLIVLQKNPLDDLRNTNSIRFVMKNGRLYDGDTLDERWPRERKQEPPYGLAKTPATAAGERPYAHIGH